MDMLAAMKETLEVAKQGDYDNISFDEVGVDYEHLKSMVDRVEENPGAFSEGKLGRWLGYMQGVLVANQAMTLEECKAINKKHDNRPDEFYHHLKRGSTYRLVGEVRLQFATPPADGDMWLLYRAVLDGSYSARSKEEFTDGRFEKLESYWT